MLTYSEDSSILLALFMTDVHLFLLVYSERNQDRRQSGIMRLGWVNNKTLDLGTAGCGAALIKLTTGTINGLQRNFGHPTIILKTDPVTHSYSVPLISLKDDTKCSKAAVTGHVSLLVLSNLYSAHA